ncbi:Permease of the drug/metabolite transporter (DMT) superfamily [Dethiosulfatibacter aminovorans DSM 17477]|uniref:Permease of the drug/metabolite transporter (DMT) superfamily n=1 Tax=Dethiosulfatibacter aminovorans DSM 17477 TaxID=1121476 RepID=A0A1M6HPU1_9FIRM|nr:DMT family transporter [Dethiosulfatibacter aminovorans]SHJ24156.1 Permease of the drug/metabolite transporter (DMT) superfamily [Dethiosulfatibacter aminovorans DSM 17477]
MKKNISSLQADLILFVVALLWGTTFVTSKVSLESLPPFSIISFRFILATLLMGTIFRKDLKTIDRKDIKGGLCVGTMLFIAFATQLVALKYTEPGKQAFLAATYVIFVPFCVWALTRKKPDNKSFIGAFACFIGIGLLTLKEGFSMGYGDSLTMLSSVFFAGHILTTEHFVKDSSPVKISVTQFGTVAIMASAMSLMFEKIEVAPSIGVIAMILYLGVFCSGIAYFLQTLGQKYTKSTHAAIIMSLEAVFGSILSVIFMHEIFTPRMIGGCVIIFGSILVIELKGSGEADGLSEIAGDMNKTK